MTYRLLSGKDIAADLELKLAMRLKKLSHSPGLGFIRIGEDPASLVYIQIKKKKCKEVGIRSIDCELPETTSFEEIAYHIHQLYQDQNVHGILLQLPLPSHLDPLALFALIDPEKDVDGFHPYNMGKLLLGDLSGYIPCTPKGIHLLLSSYDITLSGKHVVIVGRSNIVGKPLAALLMQKDPSCNATVTVAHSCSTQTKELCLQADILVAALGKPGYITQKMVRPHAVVVDVGINRQGATLVGDVDFAHVAPRVSFITPVPGGIGPMTVASLLLNTEQAYLRRRNKSCISHQK